MIRRILTIARTFALAGPLALAAVPVAAEPIVALTAQNQLIIFDSATPGSTSAGVSVSGLISGDILYGIDRRPSVGPQNGALYGFSVNSSGVGRLYTLDEVSGLAMLTSTLAADPADTTAPFPYTTVQGTSYGVDFNPAVDRLRVTSSSGQNLRINVDNGLTQLDVSLAYQTGDPNFGEPPFDVAVAYSNNFGGTTSTTLRGVDIGQSPDLLVVHTNPNGGLLQSSIPLSFDSTFNIGYDISGLSGVPYFAASPLSGGPSQFYAGTTLVGPIGGGVQVVGIAAPVGTPVPEPATLTLVGLGAAGYLAKKRRSRRARTAATGSTRN